jgi:hypothetical protein
MNVYSCFAELPIRNMIRVRQLFFFGYRNRSVEMGGMYRIFAAGSYKTIKKNVIVWKRAIFFPRSHADNRIFANCFDLR